MDKRTKEYYKSNFYRFDSKNWNDTKMFTP
jgi:hypothetical protein